MSEVSGLTTEWRLEKGKPVERIVQYIPGKGVAWKARVVRMSSGDYTEYMNCSRDTYGTWWKHEYPDSAICVLGILLSGSMILISAMTAILGGHNPFITQGERITFMLMGVAIFAVCSFLLKRNFRSSHNIRRALDILAKYGVPTQGLLVSPSFLLRSLENNLPILERSNAT